MQDKRKLILYIACSLDGYIAAPKDDLSFLNKVQKDGEDYGYAEFESTIDTVILGRRTYDWVIKEVGYFPHQEKETFVITKTERPGSENLTFYTGSLKALIDNLKRSDGKNIFCDGGAEVVHLLLKENFIDQLIISVVPTLLGNGIKLFKDGRPEQDLTLVSSKSFDTGLVQLHYTTDN
ncbi:MAG: dihydrofolate reductase [Rickettsiales bacterium]|nr:dihydrofolate reductase [Rickettsiales bacterium]